MATADDALPDYALCLDLQHAAFGTDLRSMLADLFSTTTAGLQAAAGPAGRKIADVACGDGFYSRLLAEIDESHRVVGIDSSEAYLSVARDRTPPRLSGRLSFQRGDILAPETLADGSEAAYDVIFCIDSLESILDHQALFRQMVRLCRPGGLVVISETDNVHDLIGSWPPEVDNLLHRLEWEGLDDSNRAGYALPRYASALLRWAGLSGVTVHSYTFDRSGPLDESMQRWLAEHLRHRLAALRRGTDEELTELRRHLHPEGDEDFAKWPHALLTYLRFCVIGRKPPAE